MEENFTQNDFETFLQEQVRNHRMYPKADVWTKINKRLHGDKKWPGLTIAALIFLTTSVVVSVYFSSKTNIFAIKPSIEPINISTTVNKGENVLNKLTSSDPFGDNKHNSSSNNLADLPATSTTALANIAQPSYPAKNVIAERIIPNLKPIPILDKSSTETLKPNTLDLSSNFGKKDAVDVGSDKTQIQKSPSLVSAEQNIAKEVDKEKPSFVAVDEKNPGQNSVKNYSSNLQGSIKPNSRRTKSKFSYQVYVAPSISYRKLFEDPSISKTGNSGPVGINFVTGVNKVVRHKPGAGIEAGVSFMYDLSSKVRIKTGFQFNVRQYSIDAYRSTTEVASIALIGRNGFDTVKRIAVYRNNNGYRSAELINKYYQLALPIGVEWEILGNSKIQLNVAGTIQPTYVLNRNAYLLSTNFKNYTESPEMVRPWNINSNIETFISFKSGEFKWQIGPQVRYQPYSTFIPEYPIKEHLLDYGIKVGLTRKIN